MYRFDHNRSLVVVNGRGDHDNLSSLFFYSHIVSQNKIINESAENDPSFFRKQTVLHSLSQISSLNCVAPR